MRIKAAECSLSMSHSKEVSLFNINESERQFALSSSWWLCLLFLVLAGCSEEHKAASFTLNDGVHQIVFWDSLSCDFSRVVSYSVPSMDEERRGIVQIECGTKLVPGDYRVVSDGSWNGLYNADGVLLISVDIKAGTIEDCMRGFSITPSIKKHLDGSVKRER